MCNQLIVRLAQWIVAATEMFVEGPLPFRTDRCFVNGTFPPIPPLVFNDSDSFPIGCAHLISWGESQKAFNYSMKSVSRKQTKGSGIKQVKQYHITLAF